MASAAVVDAVQEDVKPTIPQADELPALPLQCGWTLWYDDGKKRDDWFSGLLPIVTVRSAQEFWQLLNNVVWPSNMKTSQTFYFFRDGVPPKWEDDVNRSGGKFLWEVSIKSADAINGMWIGMMLSLVGETAADDLEIHGLVWQNKGSKLKMQVWNKSASSSTRIRSKLEQIIGEGSRPYAPFAKK